MKRVLFLGGKEIGLFCLDYLTSNAKMLQVELVGAVLSDKSISGEVSGIRELCISRSIPIIDSLDDIIKIDRVDFIVSVQFHLILKAIHIAVAKKMAINLHMAPLPEYRGCNQFTFAILDEVTEFGTSIHRLEEGVDSGALICEKRFPVGRDEFVSELYAKTLQASMQLFANNIANILEGRSEMIYQNDLPQDRKRGFHLRNEINEAKRIDPSWSVEKQKRHFRATYFPPFSPPVLKTPGKDTELTIDWYSQL